MSLTAVSHLEETLLSAHGESRKVSRAMGLSSRVAERRTYTEGACDVGRVALLADAPVRPPLVDAFSVPANVVNNLAFVDVCNSTKRTLEKAKEKRKKKIACPDSVLLLCFHSRQMPFIVQVHAPSISETRVEKKPET